METMHTLLVILSVLPQIIDGRKIKPPIAGGFGIPTGMVRLHAPANVTVGYVGVFNIYVYWYEPMNYHLHLPLDIAKVVDEVNKNNTNEMNVSVPVSGEIKYNVVTSSPEQETSTEAGKTPEPIDWIGHSLVPYHQGQLMNYIITCRTYGTDIFKNKTLDITQTDYHFTKMDPNTTYQITVSALYQSLTTLTSETIDITTHQKIVKDDPNEKCYCDPYGTVEGGKKCVVFPLNHVPHCTCKDGHSGIFCEKCAVTHFRTDPKGLCRKCPCKKEVSDENCDFVRDKLTCSQCKEGYTGKHCQMCKIGYWRQYSDQPCQKCYCRGRSSICDPRSGHCIGCSDHTTGYSCERCRSDYTGDPVNGEPCLHKDHISFHTGSIVIGICVGLLVLICGIAAFVLYRRWKKHPNGNKFWTVELRDDHERVNFSALPEDEIQARRMDYDFYQDQGGNRGRDGSQKYSHLHEI